LIRVHRDHYEGTPFDLTEGLAAGPFGDPSRYDLHANDGLTTTEAKSGVFGRAISMFRTSYSLIGKSRADLPEVVATKVWWAQYAPHSASYVPIFPSADAVPQVYAQGSLFQFTRDCSFWAFCTVGNWVDRTYKNAIVDVHDLQDRIETPMFEEQRGLEQTAASLAKQGRSENAAKLLQEYTEQRSEIVITSWFALFDTLIAKYHDGYIMTEPTSTELHIKSLFYPRWWLEQVGFFAPPAVEGREQEQELRFEAPVKEGGIGFTAGALVSFGAVFLAIGVVAGQRLERRRIYDPIC
jgi:dipeptidase